MSLLGVDIGSTNCKGVVFDYDGNILATSNEGYTTVNPSPSMAEIAPVVFWEAFIKITNKLSERVIGDPIEALAISSHGETFISIDKNGDEVGPAIMNSDNRATEQAKCWESSVGKEKIYKITGLPIHPMFALNKILWLKKTQPDCFNKTDKFISVGDYIIHKLGLGYYTDYSLASRTMAFDINTKSWSDDLLDKVDLEKNRLSEPLPSGTKIGSITASMSKLTGLKEGCIVALGGHDQPCGALGCGVIDSGQVSDSCGTYECLVAVSDKVSNTQEALSYNLNSYCHVVSGKYVTLAFFPAGIVNNWFLKEFCQGEVQASKSNNESVYEIFGQNITDICPGPSGVCITPHIVGACNPYWDTRAKMAMTGISPETTKYHLYKAIFEGIACELAINVSVLESVVGSFENINIYGGTSKSDFAVQLRADITGKNMLKMKSNEAVCLGAAILAGLAAGRYNNIEEAVEKAIKVKEVCERDSIMAQRYKKQFEQYKLVYPSLEQLRKLN